MGRVPAVVAVFLTLVAGACAPGDPLPARSTGAVPGLPADRLLEDRVLQALVDAELARDGATLRQAFGDADPRVRTRAARAMASVRDLGAAPELRLLIMDPDPRVREAAAFALAHYPGAGDGGEQIGELLGEERDPAVRRALIDALGKAAYARTLWVLFPIDGADRADATLALSRAVVRGSMPGGAVDTLVARMSDPDPAVRRNAAYFLERVEDVGLWIDDRAEIRRALSAMPLDDPAAMSIVDGLGRLGDPASIPGVVRRARWASDWRVRANAMEALATMGEGEVRLETLLAGLEDPSVHVRARAAAALGAGPVSGDAEPRLTAWVRSHRADRAAMGPILRLLAGMGSGEVVLEWTGRLDAEDVEGWGVALPALADVPGEEGRNQLLRAARSPEPRVARPAAAVLEDRGEPGFGIGGDLSGGGPREAPGREWAAMDWSELARLGPRPRWVLDTERGRIVLELAADQAPLTVLTLSRLAGDGRFDGVPFHRVVPNFVIQGGDLSRGSSPTPGAPRLRSEITPIPFERGVVGMANTGSPDTETSQFFITHDRQPHLDGGYTAFGWVAEGMDVVDRIGPGDRILRSRVVRTF